MFTQPQNKPLSDANHQIQPIPDEKPQTAIHSEPLTKCPSGRISKDASIYTCKLKMWFCTDTRRANSE